MQDSYKILSSIFKEIGILQSISALSQWDNDVFMPKKSFGLKQDQMVFLSGQMYQRLTDPKIAELIENCTNLDGLEQANLDIIKKKYLRNKAVDQHFVEKITKAGLECELNWRNARKNNDFKLFSLHFKPLLTLVQEMSLREAEVLKLSPYNALLDSYDPGRTSEEIDIIFNEIEKFLPSLIYQVREKQKSQNPINFNYSFSLDGQKNIGLACMKAFNFDLDRGRLDVSTHPFSVGLSPEDVRLTTRYEENNFLSGLFGILHETGHGIYEQNLPLEDKYQPVAKACGMTIHESQSLFFERHIGIAKNFFHWLEPILEKEFGSNKALKADNLYKLATKMDTSLVRVDADEVTYPAHIIMRYKLEKDLLSGDLQIDDLPEAWDEMSIKLFGAKPKNLAQGCLQDIHWAWGSIGYFPTYTLGAIFASQIDKHLRKNIDMDSLILNANYAPITGWLKDNIHNKGSKYSANELIEKSVGSKLDVNVFKEHLINKYLKD